MAADSEQLKDYQGLPLKSLLVDPLTAAAQGQRDLAMVSLDFINEFAFTTDEETKKVKTRTVDVEVERLIEGRTTPQKQTLKMPLISCVTIPNLAIDDVEIDFSLEIKSHTSQVDEKGNTQTDGSKTEAHGEVSGGVWGVKASAGFSLEKHHTGVVSSKSTHTRETDFSSKYDIKLSAKHQPPCEGMAKFTQLVVSAMEPVNTESK